VNSYHQNPLRCLITLGWHRLLHANDRQRNPAGIPALKPFFLGPDAETGKFQFQPSTLNKECADLHKALPDKDFHTRIKNPASALLFRKETLLRILTRCKLPPYGGAERTRTAASRFCRPLPWPLGYGALAVSIRMLQQTTIVFDTIKSCKFQSSFCP
jgi:hypothetical protein